MNREWTDYYGDVLYEVWMSGGNPDDVSYERLKDDWHDGIEVDDAARSEYNCQQPRVVSEMEMGGENT